VHELRHPIAGIVNVTVEANTSKIQGKRVPTQTVTVTLPNGKTGDLTGMSYEDPMDIARVVVKGLLARSSVKDKK
jgi:hypothetical protein